MKNAKNRRSAPALEWLDDACGHCARITSLGSSMLMVENHRGICSFSDDRITIATRCGCIDVYGEGLYLAQVRPCALAIRGRIARVQLPCEGGACREP